MVIGLPKVPMGNTGNILCFYHGMEMQMFQVKYDNHMTIRLILAPSSTTSALVLIF